ncbi:uncharacterized protein ACHE_40369A [Aspergillus chevalieri]|uniref:Uncharacterized protein n=1 Tax=Aspergillus chevalieri TaxID=182096 RepID=A0A7R7VNF2_ASPCH|nr:uncharacterized protein ACHE_40369A [Aspergillus chevalieri]BCR87805.1 hypothetical protein ACHE_40369A [Aspergillus chevalieri]
MKLSLAFLATLSVAMAASIPATCEDIPNSLGDKPQTLHNYFNQEVCQKSKCDTTINDSTSFLEKTVVPQLVQQLSQSLGISTGNQDQIEKVAKEVSQAIQQSCSQQYGDKKVCNDDDSVLQFGQCALKAAEPVISKQSQGDDDVPSEEECQKLKTALTDDQLWSKTLPGYVDQFAKQCKKN